jgi:5-methyltetrahydrofolate--homocysteine methyltransferase
VGDASLATGVCNSLLNPDKREAYVTQINEKQETQRVHFEANKTKTEFLSLADARAKRFTCDWQNATLKTPVHLGLTVDNDVPLQDLADYFDYSPLFWTWGLKGIYPRILQHATYGEQARSILEDAKIMLQRIIKEKRFLARCTVGLFPANSVGDDIEIYSDNSGREVLNTLHTLRQQKRKAQDGAYFALSDFVAPKESGQIDACGAFVCAIEGVDEFAKEFEEAQDDYNAIMVKAIGDRFAEALAEYTHAKVRKELWGYAPEEDLDNDALIMERYRGIRPAAGYPSQPDHTEKALIWELLDAAKNSGATLTENFAMSPGSSVSGLYFGHPEAKYFQVGPIQKDQIVSYAERKGLSLEACEKWLAPIKAY